MNVSVEHQYQYIYEQLAEKEKSYIHVEDVDTTSQLEEELEEYKIYREQLLANIKNVNMFIRLASKMSPKLLPSKVSVKYDSGKLAKLMASCNTSFNSASYAKQLYEEATGQLLYLQKELDLMETAIIEKEESIKGNLAEEASTKTGGENSILSEIEKILSSQEANQFFINLYREDILFNGTEINKDLSIKEIPLGFIGKPFPLLGYDGVEMSSRINLSRQSINMLSFIDINQGECIGITYPITKELDLLYGIQRYLLNAIAYSRDFLDDITFIDPVRCTNAATGILMPICGVDGSILRNVPNSRDKIIHQLRLIANELEENRSDKKKIIFIHSLSLENYGGEGLEIIRKLCANANYYGVQIIVSTLNTELDGSVHKNVFTDLEPFFGISIISRGEQWLLTNKNGKYDFYWLDSRTSLLTDEIKEIVSSAKQVNINNDYVERIGQWKVETAIKGNRKIKELPLGVDADGQITYIDMENSNFATFICGASRSGKSVLLHTLIADIVGNYHPDDVEMWLIDFKMTEFSRYIKNTPPHVRYILLDQSPELVYDIVDRLTEILMKRQQIFMGKWQKLSDVPSTKYMPAMIIVIDEFHVMSEILDKAELSGKGDYKARMQALLAKGAAFGMKFVFASQGFTSGTKALTDYSKKQIQQRIAMKTEYQEIVSTLDLQTKSDVDKELMENLPVYHALVKIPVDEKGNHIHKSKVLFISDLSVVDTYINELREKYHPTNRFEPDIKESYIDKKCMSIDGLRYYAFEERADEIYELINNSRNDDEEVCLILGIPKKMEKLKVAYMLQGFAENVLILGNSSAKSSIASLTMSMIRSARYQQCETKILGYKRNLVYKELQENSCDECAMISQINSIALEIHNLRKNIDAGLYCNTFYFIFGFELLAQELGIIDEIKTSTNRKTRQGLDLLTQITTGKIEKSIEGTEKDVVEKINVLDDLQYVLKNGSRYGYHLVMQFGTYGDMKTNSISLEYFKHKISFHVASDDVANIIGTREAKNMGELPEDCYRYFDGVDAVSYKPMLHQGISINGWSYNAGIVEKKELEEDSYLL